MGRFTKSSRQYVRQGRGSSQGVSALASMAGGVGSMLRSLAASATPLATRHASDIRETAALDALERRQMLFSLTITADDIDPTTGIGTKSAFFEYALPYLITDFQPGTAAPTITTEAFQDEVGGAVQSGGALFQGSNMRVLHNINPAGDVAIQPGGDQATDRWLRVVPKRNADFFAFEFFRTPVVDEPLERRRVTRFEADFFPDLNDNTGLDTNNTRLELVANNQVLQSFTGAALRALFTGLTAGNAQFPVGVLNPALGLGNLDVRQAQGQAFDTVRFVTTGTIPGNPAMRIDNVSYETPPGNFAGLWDGRLAGAQATISGPVGASVTFLDLYGRDMIAFRGLGQPQGSDVPIIDADDNGIPDPDIGNDGIGRIIFSGTDARTAFTLWGGNWTATDAPDGTEDFFDGNFAFNLDDSIGGSYDDWESAGLGFTFRATGDTLEVTGLPPGPGNVIVGSPWLRSLAPGQYNPGRLPQGVFAPVTDGFNRSDQGIFVEGGRSIGGVYVNGIVMGSSRFSGFVDRIYTGYLLGSITVEGDLGSLIVGTDAGQWVQDPDFEGDPDINVDPVNKTGGQLVIGRSVGEIAIAGRSLMDITVVGDLNNPSTRPARDTFNYFEREFVFGNPTDVELLANIRQLVANTNYILRDPRALFRPAAQPVPFGSDAWFRNDGILSAEWIGSVASGTRIRGELGGRDITNAEDTVDVFAFAADGTQEIFIEGTNSLTTRSPYYRIVDADGRTVAAPDEPLVSDGRFATTTLRFRPQAPGVYYLAVTDPDGNDDGAGNNGYTIVVTGMASTTLGALRTGGGTGFTDIGTGEGNALVVLSGNVGSIRVGTGINDGAGAEADPTETFNTVQDANDAMSFQGGTFTIPGTLFNITAGSDIGAPPGTGLGGNIQFSIGGNLGSIITGLSTALGQGVNQGDFNQINLSVGGSIGSIDIRGGIGMDQDEDDPRASQAPDTVNITTGAQGGRGDIGFFRVGFHVAGDVMNIRTSPGSTIGAFLTSQDVYGDTDPRSGIYEGRDGINIFSGFGSDVRFVDLIRFDNNASIDVLQPILGDQNLEFVDDSGTRFRISVEGAPPDVQIGTVRSLRIDGSLGVAVGQITVDLSGARILRIEAMNQGGGGQQPPGIIGIGRIIVTGSDAGSQIQITGNAEIDVWQIQAAGVLDLIENRTLNGDIVAIDVGGLNRLDIRGDLGRTQVPTWGPRLIGPFAGIGQGAGGGGAGINAPFELDDTLLDDDFNGTLYRPLTDDNFDAGNAYLDDIGSPFDPYINGLVVRAGSVQEVRVGGATGDVILLGDDSILVLGSFNSDNVTGIGRFDGIVGNIYANNIGRIELGQGIAAPDNKNPLTSTSIVAQNDIFEIVSRNQSPVTIRSMITAGNRTPLDPFVDATDGITQFNLTNADIQDSYIGATNLDRFWVSFLYGDDNISTGDIQTIDIRGGRFFRNQIAGRDLDTLRLTNVIYDASDTSLTGSVQNLQLAGVRNSTLSGERDELRTNTITIARDLERLNSSGNIDELTLDVVGRVRQNITAPNISRSVIKVSNELSGINVTGDIRGSNIAVGSLSTLTTGGDLATTNVRVSGLLQSVSVAGRIFNSFIEASGADSAIGTITSAGSISADIAAVGSVGSITSTTGDVTGSLRAGNTLRPSNVSTISAARDIALEADIYGNVQSLVAGRHIGRQGDTGVFLARGNIASVSAPNGQLYYDVRAGGTINSVTVGGSVNRQGRALAGEGSIVSFGSLGSVTINGDFGGDIISYSGGIASITVNNGSLLPGNTIAAYAGSIANLTINNGSLFANVHADINITSLRVVADAAGTFGDIGINPDLSPAVPVDANRNQLPPGVFPDRAIQGPTISAGNEIVAVVVTNGSAFESTFYAGRVIRSIVITGSVRNDFQTVNTTGNVFAAGDTIESITITGDLLDAAFVAGITSFGADGRFGGTQANADIYKTGAINRVVANGFVARTFFAAGVTPHTSDTWDLRTNAPGQDGILDNDAIFDNGNDRSIFGLSSISTLTLGNVAPGSVRALSDGLSSSVANDNRLIRGGSNLPNTNPQVDNGAGTPGTQFTGSRTFNNVRGANVTIDVTGPGTAFFNTANSTLTLRGTTSGTNITATSSTGTLDNFDIVTGSNGSVGNVTLNGNLTGDSDLIIDGTAGNITYGRMDGDGTIAIGADATSLTFGSFAGGFVQGRGVQTVRINGNYGNDNPGIQGEARLSFLSAGTITVTGASRGTLSVDRDIQTVAITGISERSVFRSGGTINSFTASQLRQSFISAATRIGTVAIAGDSFDSSIMAGLDLGIDAAFSNTASGPFADTVTNASINSVTIGGNFRESDIVAGLGRGADGFFGTSDDTAAAGRATIGQVTIGGSQVGSNRFSESYRIASTGTLGQVRIGGLPFNGTIGNFAVVTENLAPLALAVSELRTQVDSRVVSTLAVFNQPVDFSSVSRALSVSEVRGTGEITIRLIERVDYTLSYEASSNTVRITFNTAVTSQNLPQVPGRPGPGVYRIEFNGDLIRPRLINVSLDGNGDGIGQVEDNYSQDTIVGDAGDKLVAETVFTGTNNSTRLDFYAPTNLDLILDANGAADGLPDINLATTLRGFIGDHPDNDTNFFRFGGDVDVYTVTLQAGQILRLGALQGSALRAVRSLFDANLNPVVAVGQNAGAVSLPIADAINASVQTFPSDFLIRQTGTYIITVGVSTNVNVPGGITNPIAGPGTIGDYAFSIEVFDDGDSGFSSTTPSGDGTNVINAPPQQDFAGQDGVLGTADDRSEIVLGTFTFTRNNATNVVTGSNPDGITSVRGANGRLTSLIESAIGPAGHTGVPGDIVASDVDVFHLNNRQTIAPGTRLRITTKLTDLGADLGSANPDTLSDFRGSVQFGIFDTSASVTADDAILVFSPTDFNKRNTAPNTVIADNGTNRYGFDSNGDFFIEFVAPDRIGQPGVAATFALYIQGAFNTDYAIEVVTDGTGTLARQQQLFLIEAGGGIVDWLRAGNIPVEIEGFNARTLGFSGAISGLPVTDYILQSVVSSLNSIFQNAGVSGGGFDVRFATSSSEPGFEGGTFSTIYLTSTGDPIAPIFSPFSGFNFDFLSQNFLNTNPYGFSERSDPFNTDRTDEAVVFVPAMALQGFTPSPADADQFSQAITGAIARRAGELMGLRISGVNGAAATNFDPFAADVVDNRPGSGRNYSIPQNARVLSDSFDTVSRTDFFLGRQNAFSLLDKVLGRI